MLLCGCLPFSVLPAAEKRTENKYQIDQILQFVQKYFLPIPTIDEFRVFIGRGAVRLPPQAGNSCVRLRGVRGTSHLKEY